MRILDLTQTFDHEMPVYPGDPIPELKQTASIEEQGYVEYHLNTGLHVGTHMDAPLHMIKDGGMISEIPPSRFFGRGRLIGASHRETISAELLQSVDLSPGDIVLVCTGWSAGFREAAYYERHPEISPDFAKTIVEAGVSIVGLDFPSPDRAPFPIHKILLGAGVLIVENLANLDTLRDLPTFEIIALPAKLQAEGAPVRVVARY